MNEHWRGIPEFPGYEVSDLGRVRGWRNKGFGFGRLNQTPTILKPQVGHGGYHRVCLFRDGKSTKVSVHRLVLDAFVGPCPVGMEAAHRDGVRDNNRLDNLRWATKLDNSADRIAHGTQVRGERCHAAVLTEDAVRAIRASEGPSHIVASAYGIASGTVRKIRRNEAWRHVAQ